MKKSKYSDSQIMAILKQAETGVPVPELCREHGMSSATFYKWRSKYGGMDASLVARLKELEDENRRLKKMYAEERLKAEMVQYDITHTLMYPTLDGKIALKMASAKSFPDHKTLVQLGLKANINKATQIVEEIAGGIQGIYHQRCLQTLCQACKRLYINP